MKVSMNGSFKTRQVEHSQISQNFEKKIIANLFTKKQPVLAYA